MLLSEKLPCLNLKKRLRDVLEILGWIFYAVSVVVI